MSVKSDGSAKVWRRRAEAGEFWGRSDHVTIGFAPAWTPKSDALNRQQSLRRFSCGRVGNAFARRKSLSRGRLDDEGIGPEDIEEAKKLVEEWQNPPETEFQSWIPQTIEFSIRCAQKAAAFALMDSVTRLTIDLPLGRKRKNGLRWSNLDESLAESTVLSKFFCEGFQGASMRLIHANAVPTEPKIPWIDSIERLDEAVELPSGDTYDLVVIASAKAKQAAQVSKIVDNCTGDTAVVLFNCFLDADLGQHPKQSFTPVYICRRYEGGAILLHGHGRMWDCMAELSIFEFEHVSQMPADWKPTQSSLRTALQQEGIQFDNITRYYRSKLELKNAGFWPFMVISYPEVFPLDPDKLPPPTPQKKKRFGFF